MQKKAQLGTDALADSAEFETQDIYLATTLCLWFSLERMNNDNPKKIIFIFLKSDEIENVVDQYWKGNIAVDPQKLFMQYKILKNRMYQ